MKNKKEIKRRNRKYKIRKKIFGSPTKPRLSFFKSNLNFYVQLFDDSNHKTLCSASTLDLKKNKIEFSKEDKIIKVANFFLEKLKPLKILTLVVDRNGFPFEGNISLFVNHLKKNKIKV